LRIFDETVCALGEGPLWHPQRKQLFWFDILGKTLLSRDGGKIRRWAFGEHVSAAGWLDTETLLIASETALFKYSLDTGARADVCALEADNPATRSNDGRADPQGGFWIGTMGKGGEAKAGAIYRYYRGELRQLYEQISIPNAMCFAPDGRTAYFTDTLSNMIWKQRLDEAHGWPVGSREVFTDLTVEGRLPDGAVVDAHGNLWNAQWGSSRIAVYDPEGRFIFAVTCGASQVSCPAFGGDDLQMLYATSATQNLSPEKLAVEPDAGKTFVTEVEASGQAEHRVIL